MNHIYLELAGTVLGTALVTFVGWTAKFMRNIDRRLTRIETKLRLRDIE